MKNNLFKYRLCTLLFLLRVGHASMLINIFLVQVCTHGLQNEHTTYLFLQNSTTPLTSSSLSKVTARGAVAVLGLINNINYSNYWDSRLTASISTHHHCHHFSFARFISNIQLFLSVHETFQIRFCYNIIKYFNKYTLNILTIN